VVLRSTILVWIGRGAAVGAMMAIASCGDTYLSPILPADGSIGYPDGSVVDVPARDGGALDLSSSETQISTCPTALVGFAGEGPGTTGGEVAGPPLRVPANTPEALIMYAGRPEPLVIEIGSAIELTGQVSVMSDKTIRGVAPGAALTGAGLLVKGVHNVIVQNLTISKAKPPGDAITVQSAQNVWIDHCQLFSDLSEPVGTYDGLVDITHASDNVTVSWTHFHDHYDNSLVGHSPDAVLEDTNHLTVTYHHNWFQNIPNHSPRVRFGRVHVFNNLYQDITGTAVISQMGAAVFVEENYFQNVKVPITTTYNDREDGTATDLDNYFDPKSGPRTLAPTNWIPPYVYHPDSYDAVPALVHCTGPQF
jgi:pectate lyase